MAAVVSQLPFANPRKQRSNDDFVEGVEPWPLIPPGTYDAVGVKYQRASLGRVPKLVVLFDVLISGSADTHRVRLARFYNVTLLSGGRLRVGRSSDYAREWMRLTNRRVTRYDRPIPGAFVGALVTVEVQTVERDRYQRQLPAPARYSKIARIVECKAGGGPP